MRIINEPLCEIIYNPVEANRTRMVDAARICYKSVGTGRESDSKLLRQCFVSGHHSVLEHSEISIKFICDRGLSHEFVRHRLASFNQESTRYCNYSKDKFGNEITVVKPIMIQPGMAEYSIWKRSCERDEKNYFDMLELGVTPGNARSVLPTCLKTELILSTNLREWYHILDLRTARSAHPDMRYLMHGLLIDLAMDYPEIFADLRNERNPQILKDFAVLRNGKKGVEND